MLKKKLPNPCFAVCGQLKKNCFVKFDKKNKKSPISVTYWFETEDLINNNKDIAINLLRFKKIVVSNWNKLMI